MPTDVSGATLSSLRRLLLGLLLLGSPVVQVTDTTLVAGKARLPLDVVAGAVA